MARPRRYPALFRILLPARNLRRSREFYEALFGRPGREVAPGRIYFDCGPVIMGILDYAGVRQKDRPRLAEAIYFVTDELGPIYRRARRLGALARGDLHGDPRSPMGRPIVRPWGERSFYLSDPTGNSLCFVAEGTQFTGTPDQVRRLSAPPRRPAKGTRARRRTDR